MVFPQLLLVTSVPLTAIAGVALGVKGRHAFELTHEQIEMAIKVRFHRSNFPLYHHVKPLRIDPSTNTGCSVSHHSRGYLGNCDLGFEDISPTLLHANLHTQVLAHGRLCPHGHHHTILHRESPLLLSQLQTLDCIGMWEPTCRLAQHGYHQPCNRHCDFVITYPFGVASSAATGYQDCPHDGFRHRLPVSKLSAT